MTASGNELQRPAAEHPDLGVAISDWGTQRDLPECHIATNLVEAFPDNPLGRASLVQGPAILGFGDDEDLFERAVPIKMRAFAGPGRIIAADPDIGVNAVGIERQIDRRTGDAQPAEIGPPRPGHVQHGGHQGTLVIAEIADGGKGGMHGQKRQ